MRSYLIMGLFALFVVIVSLVRCLGDEEFFRLTAMKRLWGRSRGLLIFFLSHVALPMIFGIVFLSRGIVDPAGTMGGPVLLDARAGSAAGGPPHLQAPQYPGSRETASPRHATDIFPVWFNLP